jgi:hypothetical protein
MSDTVATLPSIEMSLIAELTTSFGDGYRFTSILPADILARINNEHLVVTRIKRIAGAPNVQLFSHDKPIVQVDTFYSDYATSDLAARDIQAALFSLRGKQLSIGVIQLCRAVMSPRWIADPDPSIYRFVATYQLSFHAGGVTV